MPAPFGIFFFATEEFYYYLVVVELVAAPASLDLSLAGVSLELVSSGFAEDDGCFAGVMVEPV